VNGVSPDVQAFAGQAFRMGSWRGELSPTTSFSFGGASAMAEYVLGRMNGQPGQQLRLFGPTDDDGLDALRGHAVGFIVAGAIALGMTRDGIDEDLAGRLIQAAADPNPEALLGRAHVLGERLFEPPPPVIPEWLEDLDRFVARNCFAGVVKAVLEIGKWAGARSDSYATGITSVTPPNPCQNEQITIHGAGFGRSQPTGVVVYVPTLGGGCREAKVDSWSDTAVVVRAPADIGAGCVGFVKLSGTFAEPQQVTGELASCIGPAGEVWARGFERVGTPVVTCPPCLPGGQNRIQPGGKPVINRFRCTPDLVQPGGQPTLEWNVANATSVRIDTIAGPPLLPMIGPLPPVGTYTLPPVTGLAPVTGQYLLTATNRCGDKPAVAEFSMRRIPQLSVARIEVVQSIQTPTNTVPLVTNRRTAVRVFVDSGISDGFDFGIGDGPNRVGNLHATLVAESLDTGAVFDCGYPWGGPRLAGPALDRDVLGDSINFDVPLGACDGNVQFRATVMQPGPATSSAAPASGSVNVSFAPLGKQEFLPFLVTDPSSALPTPTMGGFYSCLAGPESAHPFPDNGFTINPPLAHTLAAAESLRVPANWTWLVMRLSTMLFLFPSQPVGGVRMAVVPPDPAFYWGGMTLPRGRLAAPAMAVKAGWATVCTHELGHASGLLHVNCGGAAGPYGGLPQTISDPGLDVMTRTLVKSGSAETMSYCGPPDWPSILHYGHMLKSIPFA
jgi:hypothetical protein